MNPPFKLRGAPIATRIIASCALLASLLGGSTGKAALFLDLATVAPGGPGVGTFSGTIGGISVTGSVSGSPSVFSINGTGAGIGNSTTDGSSPQYGYSTVYSPTIALTDRVGFTYLTGATNVVTITFGSPVTNPVFHVANLDSAQFSFTGLAGLTSMTLLNGNGGGDGDGLTVTGSPSFSILDANGTTSDATLPTSTPPIAGARSAYGSVQLNGTFTTVAFGVGTVGPGTDNGSFTLSIVPEPGSLMLAGMGLLSAAGFTRRRGRKTQGPAVTIRH